MIVEPLYVTNWEIGATETVVTSDNSQAAVSVADGQQEDISEEKMKTGEEAEQNVPAIATLRRLSQRKKRAVRHLC